MGGGYGNESMGGGGGDDDMWDTHTMLSIIPDVLLHTEQGIGLTIRLCQTLHTSGAHRTPEESKPHPQQDQTQQPASVSTRPVLH